MIDSCSDVRVMSVVEPTASENEVVARWGGIIAGVFTVLALLALLGEIGVAVGLSTVEAGDRAAPYLLGAGIWGILSAILAFLGGGFVASQVSRHIHSRAGATQGLLVWAVAVPVIGVLAAILAIGTVTAAGVTTVAAVQADPVAAAEARDTARAAGVDARDAARSGVRPELDRNAPAAAKVENAARKTSAGGWAAVGAMLLSLGAAMFGGSLGTRPSTRVVERTTVRMPPMRAGNVGV
jgi:hypothetical protein